MVRLIIMMKYSLIAMLCVMHTALFAQRMPTRSPYNPASGGSGGTAERQFPCEGTILFSENFDAVTQPAAPIGWKTWDFDGGVPNVNIQSQYSGSWQSAPDYKGKSATLMASLSWYADTSVRANNWLVSKPVVLTGSRNCVSWYAYSQDFYYPETYRVRVSRHANDTSNFQTLLEVQREFYTLNYRSVQLPDTFKAGDTAYIAFQHISKNRFVLAIDSVRMSAVLAKDLGAFGVLPTYITKKGDSTRISVGIRNYGGDTLTLDSTLILNYSVNKSAPRTYAYDKSRKILYPNDTIWVKLPSYWVGGDTGAYEVCVWTSGFTDENIANDTSCNALYVGFKTNVETALAADVLRLHPNPAATLLSLNATEAGTWSLFDMVGATRIRYHIGSAGEYSLSIDTLPAGVYGWQFQTSAGEILRGKLLKE
jgi:hypothetical protein